MVALPGAVVHYKKRGESMPYEKLRLTATSRPVVRGQAGTSVLQQIVRLPWTLESCWWAMTPAMTPRCTASRMSWR